MVELTVEFEPGRRETTRATSLGGDLWRLEESTLFVSDPLYRGDVVHLTTAEAGLLRFSAIHSRSVAKHFTWLVGRGFIESVEHAALRARVDEAGGSMEAAMGGMLFMHLPPDSTFEPERELDAHLAAFARRHEPWLSRMKRWFTGQPFKVTPWPD